MSSAGNRIQTKKLTLSQLAEQYSITPMTPEEIKGMSMYIETDSNQQRVERLSRQMDRIEKLLIFLNIIATLGVAYWVFGAGG